MVGRARGGRSVERWILARLCNRRFFDLRELNTAIAGLLEELNRRPFKRLPGCRASVFEAVDRPALELDEHKNARILEKLNSDRFVDVAPAAADAKLPDEDVYLGSLRTFHRRLAETGSAGDRRALRRHRSHAKSELLAMAPDQVWSWDISILKGPAK